jgi:hypothetical protein
MNLKRRDTLYGGEAFSVKTSTGQNWNSGYLHGCWGSFTKHYNSGRSTVAFTIHFNTYSPDISLREISDQHSHAMNINDKQALLLWNYDVVMPVEDIRKEFAYLKRHLKAYVDYRYLEHGNNLDANRCVSARAKGDGSDGATANDRDCYAKHIVGAVLFDG